MASEPKQLDHIPSDIQVMKLDPNWKASKAKFQALEQAGCGTKKHTAMPGHATMHIGELHANGLPISPKITKMAQRVKHSLRMTPEDGDEPHIETNMRHGAISDGEKIKTEMMDATLSAQHSGRANEVIFASGRQEELEEVQSG